MTTSRRTFFLVTGVVLALAISAIALHRSRGQRALQKYKAELIARGEKLSYAELVGTDSFGVRDSLTKLLGAAGQIRGGKLAPSTLGDIKYVAPGRVRPVWKEKNPWAQAASGVGALAWLEFATQVASVEGPLAEIREAAQDPAPDLGLGTNFVSGPIRNFVAMRTAAQWLAGAALSDVHEGDLDAAVANLDALAGLAQFNRDELTLVAQMIRVALTGLGLSVTWQALQAEGWTEPQLLRLQKAWEAVLVLPGLERAFVGERALGTELFTGARRSGTRFSSGIALVGGVANAPGFNFERAVTDFVVYPLYRLTSIEEDELLRLQAMQEAILAVRAVRHRRPWKEASQGLSSKLAYLEKSPGLTKRFRFMLSLISVPNFPKALDRGVRVEAQRQMTIAAMALMRFRIVHGKFPTELNELWPRFLQEPSFDPFSGGCLKYRLKPGGSFVLYSVGDDATDDGGNAEPVGPGKPGLWEGRDAVWPEAAE